MLEEIRENPRARMLLIVGAILIAIALIGSFVRVQIQNRAMQEEYENAMELVRAGEYDSARAAFASLSDYRDASVLRNYALARSEMESGDAGQAEIMLETIPLDYEGDMSEEIMAYKNRGFDEDLKNLQSTMEWLEDLNEEGAEGTEGTAGEGTEPSNPQVPEPPADTGEEEEMIDVTAPSGN